jgi:CheY-like chemotaxis protein
MKSILLIEDHDEMREMLVATLTPRLKECFHGEVSLITADSWDAGIAIIRAAAIDVVICDLVLPPMHWQDTLDMIHVTPGLPPIIAISGYEGISWLRENCIAFGAEDFVTKSAIRREPEKLCELAYICALRRQRPKCPTLI